MCGMMRCLCVMNNVYDMVYVVCRDIWGMFEKYTGLGHGSLEAC